MQFRPFSIRYRVRVRLRRSRRFALALAPVALAAAAILLDAAHPRAACEPDAVLVNPCRPWLGAAANDYPQVSTSLRDQIEYHEQRIGADVDIAHSYHSPTEALPLSNTAKGNDERYFVTRPNTYMFMNWKPAAHWADASGGNATVNAKIDEAADNIASVAPHKVFLTLHHEPRTTSPAARPAATPASTRPARPAAPCRTIAPCGRTSARASPRAARRTSCG